MAKEYFEKLSTIIAEISFNKTEKPNLTIKHFFSGAAVYANGQICITLTPAGFALKLPTSYRDHLLRNLSAMPLQYFPNAPIKKEYVLLPDSIVNDAQARTYWVEKSIEYVSSNFQEEI